MPAVKETYKLLVNYSNMLKDQGQMEMNQVSFKLFIYML